METQNQLRPLRTLNEFSSNKKPVPTDRLCDQCKKIPAIFKVLATKRKIRQEFGAYGTDPTFDSSPYDRSIPVLGRPSNGDTAADLADHDDSQNMSITVRKNDFTNSCPSCEVIFNALSVSEIYQEYTELYLSAVSIAEDIYALVGSLEGISLYLSPNSGPDPFVKNPIIQDPIIRIDSIVFSSHCLQHCKHNHKYSCSISPAASHSNSAMPIYLIDLRKRSLVRGSTQMGYAALSYVRGLPDLNHRYGPWECSKETLPIMQESGFFDFASSKFPQTILDAMHFTSSMGLQYLWVDRYCIVQDDEAERHCQIQGMGSIYYHSQFTVIAADGDVTHGLYGPVTGPRLCGSSQSSPEIQANVCVCYEPAAWGTRWATRGWTFQEYILANRCFIFRQGTIIFKCQESIWHEGISSPLELESSSYGLAATKLTIHKWPNMLYFKGLLEEFVGRELSYPCDFLNAFTGVLRKLEASFPAGFLFGLPEVCFDIALLWQSRGTLVDRTSLLGAESSDLLGQDLPSWSWSRWLGPMDFTAWEAAAECLFLSYYQQNFCIITKTVDWQKSLHASKNLTPVANCFGANRGLARDQSLRPPAGWKRDVIPHGLGRGSTINLLLGSANRNFVHESFGNSAQFRFPIPLPVDEKVINDGRRWSPNIRGRVKSAFLLISQTNSLQEGQDQWFSIMAKPTTSENVSQIGVVRLHDATSEDWFYGNVFGEFIEISAGEFLAIPGQSVGIPWSFLEDWELKRRTENGNRYQFYNVMLIRRHNGIAERKGLGRVKKVAWEGMDLAEIDITLG